MVPSVRLLAKLLLGSLAVALLSFTSLYQHDSLRDVRKSVSRTVGLVAATERIPAVLLHPLIWLFSAYYNVRRDEMVRPLSSYRSFQDFFTREVKPRDIAYNQTLGFLPPLLRGTSVNVSYARTYASQRRNGLAPHRVSGRLGYAYRRFNGSLGAVWIGERPDGVYGRYREAVAQFDTSLNWKLTRALSTRRGRCWSSAISRKR